jgi:ABC-type nitrate/sulfonate/bicarbonate transport system ATPase subunit
MNFYQNDLNFNKNDKNDKNVKLFVKNIEKSFENLMVIKDVSLYMEKNEFVSVLGLSGSGKSTIFNIISGLLVPDKGEIIIDGKNYTGKTGRVSYMYQKDLLLPWKKIIDNVALPLILKGEKKKEAREKAQEYFKIFGLENFEYRYPYQLSGGMRQRAALLRTYMFSRDIMLLDEPFGGLDAITRFKIQCWLLNVLSEIDTSVLFITHDVEEAVFLSDRLYILADKPTWILEEIRVDLPRPRDKKTITSERFTKIKEQVLNIMDSTTSFF